MNLPDHLLRLALDPHRELAESVHIVTQTDVQWGTPVFRAPALPTPHQLNSELPFTQNFRPFVGPKH